MTNRKVLENELSDQNTGALEFIAHFQFSVFIKFQIFSSFPTYSASFFIFLRLCPFSQAIGLSYGNEVERKKRERFENILGCFYGDRIHCGANL